MRKVKNMNHHHLLPRCKSGTWHENNIVLIEVGVHEAIHRMFEADDPITQLKRLLYFNSPALTTECYKRVMNVLEKVEDNGIEYIYKNGVFKPS